MTDIRHPIAPDGGGRVPLPRAWRPELLVGLVMAAVGLIVVFAPGGSLTLVSVLVGVLVLVAGVLDLVRALGTAPGNRVWSAAIGMACIVVGVLLIRHLHVTLAVVALLLGLVWIVQGVVEIIQASEAPEGRRAWGAAFGAISVVAGVVVVAAPVGSLTALAVLIGLWFVLLGALHVVGALAARRRVIDRHRAVASHGSPSIGVSRPDPAITQDDGEVRRAVRPGSGTVELPG